MTRTIEDPSAPVPGSSPDRSRRSGAQSLRQNNKGLWQIHEPCERGRHSTPGRSRNARLVALTNVAPAPATNLAYTGSGGGQDTRYRPIAPAPSYGMNQEYGTNQGYGSNLGNVNLGGSRAPSLSGFPATSAGSYQPIRARADALAYPLSEDDKRTSEATSASESYSIYAKDPRQSEASSEAESTSSLFRTSGPTARGSSNDPPRERPQIPTRGPDDMRTRRLIGTPQPERDFPDRAASEEDDDSSGPMKLEGSGGEDPIYES